MPKIPCLTALVTAWGWRQALAGLAGVALAALLAACGGATSPPAGLTLLLQNEARPDLMTALLVGELTPVDDCLRVRDESGVSYALVWPMGFALQMEGETAVVLDATGQAAARSGAPLSVGGGEIPAERIDEYVLTRPTNCPGPYWAVSNLVSQ